MLSQNERSIELKLSGKIPWWGKIVGKIILSRIPIEYRSWYSHVFTHGDMANPDYAYSTFIRHYGAFRTHNTKKSYVCLELGPGDSLFTSMIAFAYGAAHTYLVDVGAFATCDMSQYRCMAAALRKWNIPFPEIESIETIEGLLGATNADYFTSGLSSLREIPSSSVDLIWSEATLEHIRLSEFSPLFMECKRILRPGGLCSHRVDLRDHLSGGLNNLRFGNGLWESRFMSKSGFYTNRVNYRMMLNVCEDIGFGIEADVFRKWDELPLNRRRIAEEFREYTDEELCISGFDLILRC